MIWYRAFLETRSRFYLSRAMLVFMALVFFPGDATKAAKIFSGVAKTNSGVLWGMFVIIVAGAGINTQTTCSTRQGVHGSIFFTLSLPVSRRKLLLTRAAVGYAASFVLAIAACLTFWISSPAVRSLVTLRDLLTYAVSLFVGTLVFHSFAILFATFLDEMWQFYASAAVCMAALMIRPFAGTDWDIFRLVGDRSIPVFGGVWWPGFAGCLLLSAAILLAAIRLVERREYK
jgi:hypothetical protein